MKSWLPAMVFEMHRHWLKEDIPVVIEARVTSNRDGGTRGLPMPSTTSKTAREQFARRLVVPLMVSSAGWRGQAQYWRR